MEFQNCLNIFTDVIDKEVDTEKSISCTLYSNGEGFFNIECVDYQEIFIYYETIKKSWLIPSKLYSRLFVDQNTYKKFIVEKWV